jgi:hypothetical protein
MHRPSVLALALCIACASVPPVPTLEQRTATLQGRVRLGDGAPAVAVRVRLFLAGGVQDAATGPEGAFEMTLLEPGEGRLAFCGGGVEPGQQGNLKLGAGERLVLDLPARPALPGALACDAFFAAAAQGEVPSGWGRKAAREPLQPVRPIKAGAAPKYALLTLRGTALDAAGAPVAVRVQLRRADEEPLLREAQGPQGRFSLEGLEPGRYDLEAQAEGGTQVVRGLWLAAGKPREVTLRFGARRGEVRVRGRALGPGGALVAGARLVAALGQGSVLVAGPVHTGADGRFDFSLPAAALSGGASMTGFVESVRAGPGAGSDGRLRLFGSTLDGLAGSELLPETADGDLDGDLPLSPAPARRLCSGAVTFPDGSPVSGVTLTSARGRTAQAQPSAALSDASGRFRLACPEGGAVLRGRLGPALSVSEVSVPAEELVLRLGPGAALRVKVTAKMPLKRLVVRVLALDDAEPAPLTGGLWRRAESEGEAVEVDGLPIGRPVEFTVQGDDGSAQGVVAQGSVVLPGASVWDVEVAAE